MEQARTKGFEIMFWEFSKASCLRIRGCMKFDMCRAKLKAKGGVHYQSDGVHKLLCCTRSRILQAANAVHLTVVLCDLR